MLNKAFFTFLHSKAEQMRKNVDPCRGGDGGAGLLSSKVSIYIAGTTGAIPTEWEDYYKEFLRENDKDTKERYQQYLKLKAEFDK